MISSFQTTERPGITLSPILTDCGIQKNSPNLQSQFSHLKNGVDISVFITLCCED